MNTHANDPEAAKIAGRNMKRSGKAEKHKKIVFREVKANQGLTAGEIGQKTGLGHIEAQRRISDLKNDGIIEYGSKRRCEVNGTFMSTVKLTRKGKEKEL